jgi:hypothetical protein
VIDVDAEDGEDLAGSGQGLVVHGHTSAFEWCRSASPHAKDWTRSLRAGVGAPRIAAPERTHQRQRSCRPPGVVRHR